MGVVYRAWQLRLAHRVALKIIGDSAVDGTRVKDDWLREAHSGARVRDPRVVQIHDVGEAEGCRYLVLEYVPGGSLKARLDGPLPPAASAALAEQIAVGVAAIHRAGVLHLDLKPSNILLDSEPGTPWESSLPKVADFGIARRPTDRGWSAQPSGDRGARPRTWRPSKSSRTGWRSGRPRTCYAVGAILYELLTGRPPFRAASLAETLEQIRHRDPRTRPPPESGHPEGPRDDLCGLPPEGPEASLSDRRGARERPAAMARGPAHRGATDLDAGTGLAMGSPPPAHRRPRDGTRRDRGPGHR